MPKKSFQTERSLCLVDLDLILSKAQAVTDPIVVGAPGIVFPIGILESCSNVLLSLNSGGGRLCVGSKSFLSP
jgi:hypothetical protein